MSRSSKSSLNNLRRWTRSYWRRSSSSNIARINKRLRSSCRFMTINFYRTRLKASTICCLEKRVWSLICKASWQSYESKPLLVMISIRLILIVWSKSSEQRKSSSSTLSCRSSTWEWRLIARPQASKSLRKLEALIVCEDLSKTNELRRTTYPICCKWSALIESRRISRASSKNSRSSRSSAARSWRSSAMLKARRLKALVTVLNGSKAF